MMGEMVQCFECEFPDGKVHISNPTSVSRLPLSRATWYITRIWDDVSVYITAGIVLIALKMSPRMVTKRLQLNCQARRTDQQPPDQLPTISPELPVFQNIAEMAQCLRRALNDPKLRGTTRLLLSRFGQPGSISVLVLPLGGKKARQGTDATAGLKHFSSSF
ncbi:hypothetical protein CSKR_107076 [Clonorchis sinensis]|uniref:Uncharacterized protein n=1 Tax=Clonorchis sinensis TaxID=79923 RepID=A0A3R7K069_CLOSI|nr:hypothetical protein CSKR_107076 [Clonorchis sinensis]